jgi:hypothetical protein
MADFSLWAEACGRGIGWPAGAFLVSYAENRAGANDAVLADSPLVEPLRRLLADSVTWEGTASELLDELTRRVGEAAARRPDWPKLPHVLSGRLRRLAPNLRASGLELSDGRTAGRRMLRIVRSEPGRGGASLASPASPAPGPPDNPDPPDTGPMTLRDPEVTVAGDGASLNPTRRRTIGDARDADDAPAHVGSNGPPDADDWVEGEL